MWIVSLQFGRRVVATVALVVIVVIVAACGPSTPPTPKGSIATTLGISELSLASLQDLERQANTARQQQLELCMKGEGFTYRQELQPEPALQDRAGTQTEEEFVERFGWGIVYSITEDGRAADASAAARENAEMYRGLSASERDAYDLALDGTIDRDGCTAVADQATIEALPNWGVINQYDEEIDQTIERFGTDLRILAFHRKWSTCMRGFALDYSTPDELSRDIVDQLRGGPDDLTMTIDDWNDEVRSFELDAAEASLKCGVGPAVYGQPEVYKTVLDGLEQRFLSENPEFLSPAS